MDSEDNNYTTTNQTYKIWKKHSPFLYNILQVYELSSCSQSVDWFNDYYIDNDWKICSLLIGSNSISQNSLQVVSIALPTDDSVTDYSIYREQKPEISIGSSGFVGTMGLQQLTTRTTIPQASQIMKARINRHDQNLVAVKTGGADAQLIVYDLRNKQDQLETNCLKLTGHTEEGMALSWSPHSSNRLLSGSYDKIINVYDINAYQATHVSLKCSDGVEDVKWSNFEPNIFCSAHQDQKIHLWDLRQGEGKPFISRKAHVGEVYSVDFSTKDEFLLLSGGEDGDVCLWDIRNIGKKLHTFVGHNNEVNVVSWSPTNSLQFASGSSDNRIVIWDIEKLNDNTQDKNGNQIITQFIHGGHRSKVTDLNWGKQKDLIGSCEQNNVMQVWKMSERIQSDV